MHQIHSVVLQSLPGLRCLFSQEPAHGLHSLLIPTGEIMEGAEIDALCFQQEILRACGYRSFRCRTLNYRCPRASSLTSHRENAQGHRLWLRIGVILLAGRTPGVHFGSFQGGPRRCSGPTTLNTSNSSCRNPQPARPAVSLLTRTCPRPAKCPDPNG